MRHSAAARGGGATEQRLTSESGVRLERDCACGKQKKKEQGKGFVLGTQNESQ
jgi:hypothetical protein